MRIRLQLTRIVANSLNLQNLHPALNATNESAALIAVEVVTSDVTKHSGDLFEMLLEVVVNLFESRLNIFKACGVAGDLATDPLQRHV